MANKRPLVSPDTAADTLAPAAPADFSGSGFSFDMRDTAQSDRVQAAARIAAERRPSFADTLSAAIEQNSITNAIVERVRGPEFAPDPNYLLTEDSLKQLAEQYKVPMEYLDNLHWSTSEAHTHHIMSSIQKELEAKQTLSAAGWTGISLSMAANVLDPVSLALNVTPAGVAAWATKGGFLKGALKGGLIAGTQNAGSEALLRSTQYTSEPGDVVSAGLMGFVLGSGTGAFAGAMANRAANLRAAAHLEQLRAEGHALTPHGEAELARSGGTPPLIEPLPAEPFGAGSVGAAQAEPGTIAPEATAFLKARNFWGIPVLKELADPFAKMTAWGASWGHAAARLFDDPVGKASITLADGTKYKPASGVNAAEWASLEMKRYHSAVDEVFSTHYTDYAKRNGINWFKSHAEDTRRAFHEDLTLAVRGDAGVLARNPEAAAAAPKIAALNEDILKKMKALGVEGADEVDANAFYMMRQHDHDRIRLLHGDKEHKAALYKLVGESIQRARPELTLKRSNLIAERYLKTTRTLEIDKKNLGLLTDNGYAKFAASLREGDVFTNEEVDDILGFVFNDAVRKPGDAGAPARLKRRALLDENHSITYRTADGKTHQLGMKDLFVNDARLLMQKYIKQTTGLMGLAKVGLRSRKDIDAMIQAAVDEDVEKGVVNEQVVKRREYLERMVRAITGAPMYDGFGSRTESALRALKNANFVLNMGEGAVPQLAEIGQLVTMKLSMALRSQVPAIDHVLNLARTGTMPGGLRRDLIAMGAVAREGSLRKPVPKYLTGDSIDHGMTKLENVSNRAAHAMSKASGMEAINDFERLTMAEMYSNRLFRLAAGLEKMDASMQRRLATNGIDGDELDTFFEQARKYVEVDPKTKEVVGVDYEAWERAHPASYDQFRLAIHREAYRSIQEVSLGASPQWTHSSFGGILVQFRSFVLNAWTKQTLHGLNHADPQTFMSAAFTTMFGMMGYAAQTSTTYLHDPAELDKRLAWDEVMKAGFNRAGWSSLLPATVDSILPVLGQDKMFGNGRTTNLSSDWITGIPTVALLDKVWGAGSSAAQSIMPDALQTNPHPWSKKEMGQLLGLLPNYYGVRTLAHDVKSQFE